MPTTINWTSFGTLIAYLVLLIWIIIRVEMLNRKINKMRKS